MKIIPKNLNNLPVLIIIVAVATYVGFGPLMEFSESNMAKQFLSAGFGAIFIAFITLFLMEQQSKNEEKREKESRIFEQKIDAFKALINTLRETVQKNRDSKSILTKEDLEKLIFDISQIRMHCDIETIDKIATSLYQIFYDEDEDKIKARVNEAVLIEELFKIVEKLNLELFPDAQPSESQKEKNSKHLEAITGEFKQLTTSLNERSISKSGSRSKSVSSGPTIFYANTRGRVWSDLREHGFWQGGLTKKINSNVGRMVPGDIICAYLSGEGYLGVGRVVEKGVVGSEWKQNSKLIQNLSKDTLSMLELGLGKEDEEMFVKVDWTDDTCRPDRSGSLKEPGLFASPMTVCRLNHEPTIDKLKARFGWPKNKI